MSAGLSVRGSSDPLPLEAAAGCAGLLTRCRRSRPGSVPAGRRRQASALVLLLAIGLPAVIRPQEEPPPDAAMQRALTEAEAMLRRDEPQAAESWYREALLEGWLLLGDLHRAGGAPAEARAAYERALVSALEARRPLLALAELALERGDPEGAVEHLLRLLARSSGDGRAVRLLARTFNATGRPELAVQQLEGAVASTPEDVETRFALASGYLRLERPEAAGKLFREVAEERPIPQTWILIGRTWRDYGEYARAREALQRAIEQDPRVPRARFYLGTVELLDRGRGAVEEAIERFREESRIAPEDPVNSLYLGMVQVDARRFEEALPSLELAVESESTRPNALHHLGRALLGLDRPREAAAALERAIGLAEGGYAGSFNANQMESLHYQLALALRRAGDETGAKPHFEAAERFSVALAESSRDRMSNYLDGHGKEPSAGVVGLSVFSETPVSGLPPEVREQLERTTRTTLARASFNLGVMATQARRFVRAADHFEQAATLHPGFPRVHYSLGVARFNAGRFDRATAPLSKALEETPGDPALRRMLALAWLNAEVYDRAAELLATDPARAADRSLQYAYGLALVRSGRTAEAQPIFDRLLAEHADWPELNVLLGQAAAQEGDFDAAVEHLERAIELRPDVVEAQATLGNIYLRQGRLAEAGAALRAELAAHPADHRSRYVLATVLELDNQPQAALREVELVLAAEPDFADAGYLRGKILLEDGRVEEAAAQLLAAAELAPEDPNIRNQLGQAYRKLGDREKAREQFEIFQRLKGRSDP